MESLGEKLRTTREDRGLSLDQVGLDTRLAMRYIEALESENFSKFPGEAYITGFIRNYGAYLELDVEELLSLYKAIKIQEQPIPVEYLLKKPSVLPKIALGLAAAVLIFVIVGIILLFVTGRTADAGVSVAPARIPIEYIMSGDSFEHRFFQGDSVLISLDPDFFAEHSVHYRLELLNVVDNNVIIGTPAGTVAAGAAGYSSIDFDLSGSPDLRVFVLDFVDNNVGAGALLRLQRYAALAILPEPEAPPAGTAAVTGQVLSSVIFYSPNPYPFTLQANFQRGSMFRWEVLAEPARRERHERFFQNLDELTVPNVHNGVRVWTSNAQAARLQVIGGGRSVPVELGSPGEVVVADIRWVRGEDNVFRLMVTRLDA